MRHYIELTLIKNAEIPLHFILAKLYNQLHLALVEIKDEKGQVAVGVGFPGYQRPTLEKRGFLGDKLRLFSNDNDSLEKLQLEKHLKRLEDYLHKTSVRETPLGKVKSYVCYTPKRLHRSALSRARRYAERHPSEENDVQTLAKRMLRQEDTQGLPFLTLQSLSNGNPYRLYIEEQRIDVAPQGIQYFNTFGLSTQAYLPLF